jgi:hypothetical protein
MISATQRRDDHARTWRSWIVVSAGSIFVVTTVALLKPLTAPAAMIQGKSSSHLISVPSALKPVIKSTVLKSMHSSHLSGSANKAATTKLEWQQGWQPNAWQLPDGDWPDEGGRFSEGQTYPEDPATFKIHQTYAFVPGHSVMSKSQAESYWEDLQKRFFRQTPSRTTYPAVPVIFDEDDNGGHSRVEPLTHRTDHIYINSMDYPKDPAHFKSTATKQSLSEIDPSKLPSSTASDAVYQLRKEFLESEEQNKVLERQLAEVEKHLEPAADENEVDAVPASIQPASMQAVDAVPASMPFDLEHDAGESQDWKEVLFMQGALYEMQKKLADQEDENQNLRNQLAKWKAKVSVGPKVENAQSSIPSNSKFEQDQISQLKSLIEKIQQQQKATDLENSKLRTQLSAIQKLTIKKANLDNGKDGKQSLKSLSSASKIHTALGGKVQAHSESKQTAVKKAALPAGAEKEEQTSAGEKEPAPAQSKQATIASQPVQHSPIAAKQAAKQAAAKQAAASSKKAPAQVKAAPTQAKAAPAQAKGVPAQAKAAPAQAKAKASQSKTPAAKPANATEASLAAFRQASLATKDAVVRELAADEESSIDSDAAAIFSSGTAVDEIGDSGHDGFGRLHSLERSALGQHSG